MAHVRHALEIDSATARAHVSRRRARGSGDLGLRIRRVAARRAIELAPGDANLRLEFGTLLVSRGDVGRRSTSSSA
jgi:hypothetical protein